MRRGGWIFVAIVCVVGRAAGAVTGVHSISGIEGGTRLTFEGFPPNQDPNPSLLAYGISATNFPVPCITSQFVPVVAGNADAPVGGGFLFNPGTISTAVTGPGWGAVGLSLGPELYGPLDWTFTFSAFDRDHNLLYTDSHREEEGWTTD